MFAGPGTMRGLCGSTDWSATRFGPVDSWPQSLRTTVEIVLGSSFPMIVLWGPDLLQIYNDNYIPFLGTKHPQGLAISTEDCWPEAWSFNEPIYRRVMQGETLGFEDQLYQLLRRGPDQPPDDVYITLSYSPVRDEAGAAGGVLVTLLETTDRVRARQTREERDAMYEERGGLLAASEKSRLELEAANAQLHEQKLALDIANYQLQESAAELEATTSELEASTEELQNTLAALEERTEAAEAAERTLSTVFAQAPAAVSVTSGPEHRFILVNAHAEEIVGRSDLVGKSLADAFPELKEQGFADIFDRVYKTGERFCASEAPVSIRRPDGTMDHRWFDFVYEPLRDAGGAVTGVLSHSVDVSARIAAQRTLADSERQFRTLADAIPTLAWTANADGYIDWYNARWYEYTGATPSEMEGWGWQSVHDPEILPGVVDRWSKSIATGEPFEMTFPLRAADGTYRPFLTRVSPVKDEKGLVTRWFGTNTDVTLEEAARREAQEANAAKSQFLANMSHELRQPLNAITGYADLIALGVRGPVTEQQRGDLERIRSSSTHLTSLISDILQFAKLEAGQLVYNMTNVPVAATLREAGTFVAPQVREKALIFAVEPFDESVTVRADRERFVQIVLNLLTNATKFTGNGGSVTITAELAGQDGDMVAIRVADTGIGIPADKLQTIFDPFVQVHRSLSKPSEGTGLGLAIARDIAKSMDGDLCVESDEGVGSVFVLTLHLGETEQATV